MLLRLLPNYAHGFPAQPDTEQVAAGWTFLLLPATLPVVADWGALARAIQQARARYGLSQGDLAERVGVSVKTINNIENGRHEGIRPTTRHKLEVALGWAAGSVHDVLGGGKPTVTEENPRPAAESGGSPVGPAGEDGEEILFRLPPGLSPREREAAKRIATASIREYLATLQEDD